MELLLLLIIVGVVGYLIGRYLRRRSSKPASQQTVEATAKDVVEAEKPEA